METVIQISLNDLLIFSIPVAVLLSFVAWLFKEWIGVRIDKSIQHEYDKKLEEYRFAQLQRQKAELIARFFAKWIKYRGMEESHLSKKELFDYYEELNQMSFEIALWIKDRNLLTGIMKRLKMDNDSKSIWELLCEVRTVILGEGSDFNYEELVYWPKDESIFNK